MLSLQLQAPEVALPPAYDIDDTDFGHQQKILVAALLVEYALDVLRTIRWHDTLWLALRRLERD